MYGAFNPTGNPHFIPGGVKYYSPMELSKICRQNQESPSARESENFLQLPRNGEIMEQERPRRHHQERDVEEKLRRKINKERRKSKREGKAGTSFGPYYMMTNQEDEEKKERKHRRDKKKEFSELNYYDLQCLINDCNRDTSMPSNLKKDRNYEMKKHQRSHSTDQIPTKDISSDQRLLRRPERPRSAERREDPQMEKNKEFFLRYYSQNQPTNPMPFHDQRGQHFLPPNQQIPIQHSPKKHKEKSKNRRKTLREEEMPEFVTLNQINEQTMNLKEEKFEQHKNKWEAEKNIRHHQQREFYGEYHQQHNRNNLDSQNNDHDLNTFTQNPEEYNKILHNYYQPPMTNEVGVIKTKKKEKKKDRNKDQKKKENDKEYKALKKYMKRLAKEQKKETFYFTTKDNGEAVAPVHDKRQNKNKKYAEENMPNFEPDLNQNNALGNIDTTRGNKHTKKEFIPLELGVEEQEIAPKHRKTHEHKKQKTKRETMKRESAERMRSASLTTKEKHKNFNNILQKNDEVVEDMNGLKTKYKSETSLDSTTNDKNIVCIYQSKDSPDEKEDATTVKLTKKQECVSIETGRKYHKKEVPENTEKEKERSPYNRTQTVLPTEHKKQMADILNTQERTLLFQKAMKRDFPSRPRPRLSRSRQRSSRYLAKLEDAKYNNSSIKIDEKPTKEVHCYDVGTSTILDNNFGEVLELLKGEPSVIPPCTNKKRSVFHVKKNTSREELVETSRKASDNSEQTTLGIVVKGIEPPKKIETSKVRSRFKFPSEKTKVNRLECKILSVVAIAPTKFDNEQDEIDQNVIKTQSTPQMQHETISTEIRNPSPDKRLERLLKYYKVEARSKISNHANDSQKSIKELIADKLSDYLKKLQENGNDDMLQIQTDDPKVVKLVLPIEFAGLDRSKPQVPQQKSSDHVAKRPKESFSDLYINYSAGNNAEDDDFFNLDVPKDISVKRSMLVQEANKSHSENLNSHQSFDSKMNEPKSNQNSFNFSGIENRSEFTFNPRMTENRKSTECDLTKDHSFSDKQMSQNSFPKLPVQNTQLNIDNNNNYRKHEDEYYNSANSPTVNVSERQWKEDMSRTEQAYSTGRENSESYIRPSPTNMVENPHQQQMNEMIMLNLTQESNSNASAPVLRQSNEKLSMGIPKSGNIECKNYFQVERARIPNLYNIVEDRVEVKEKTEVNVQRSSYNYQPQLSRNGGLQLKPSSPPDGNDVKQENERLSYQYNSQPPRNEGLSINLGYSMDGDDLNRENDQRTLHKYQQQLSRNEGLPLNLGSSPDGYDSNRQSEQRPPCKYQPQPLRSDCLQLNSELPPDSYEINQENEQRTSYKYQLQPLRNEGLQLNSGSSPDGNDVNRENEQRPTYKYQLSPPKIEGLQMTSGSSPDGNENEQRPPYKYQLQPLRNEGFQLNAGSSPDGVDVNRENEPRQLQKYQLEPLRNEGLQFNSGSFPDGNDKYCENEQRSFPKHQSQPSRNEGLQLNIGSDINHESDYSHFSTPRQKATLNKPYDEKAKFSCKKENENPLPGNESGMLVNKNHTQQYADEDLSFSFTPNQRNPCLADDSGKNNSQTRQVFKSTAEHNVPLKKKTETGCTNERKKIGKTNISQSQQQPIDTTTPSKKYEYFEIPPPRSKSTKKPTSGMNDGKSAPTEHKTAKTSQIPKRIMSSSKTMDKDDKQSPLRRSRKEDLCTGYENLGSITWDYQKNESALDNSLQKCLHWNIRNSETIVMSEFNDEVPNKTSEIGKNTSLPKKSNIPISKKDQNKTQGNQGKSPPAGKDKTPTMLLTKTFKPFGQSSYEKRKMYDTRIRKNVKRRSLSESSPPCKISPLVYEVRYCNVYNQCSPFDPAVLGASKSDQSLSIFSSEFNANDFKKSIESLTTAPSCFLKSNKYKEEDLTTEPSCFLKENNYERDDMNLSTDPSCLLKESKYCRNKQQCEVCLSTEPSCLLKESRYKFTSGQKRVPRNMKRIPIEENQDYEETCSNYSSKSDRIKELIKENLLYVKYPTPNKKIKPPGETRKRKKRVEKEKSHIGSKISNKPKSKTKITLRCTKKSSKENGKRLKIIARLNEKRDDEDSDERPENQDDHISLRQNLTKLSIDKVNGNEFRVSFEELKLGSVEDEVTFGEKSADNISADNDFANDRESIDNSVSSISTVINCEACSSVTSNESKETVKERELINTSADDSGYLTKGADLNNSGTTIDSTNDGKACCSNIFKGFSSKLSEKKSGIPRYKYNTPTEENSKWNQKDLVKLRIQLLFPHVYDDFELLETAQNTDLIKYYVESENDKLKEAIDSISQKEEMNTKSRSVISLPSVKVIPEEPSELPVNGDNTSEYSSVSQEGGFYNYQKFIAQNNVCYSANVLSKLNKSEVVGDGSDTATLKDHDISETASVNSCSVSSVKSGASMKKSVVELFKLRPSSAKKSSSSVFSDNETLVEANECNSMNINISDEEFFNNFHQIMSMECQKYAKKVRDQSKANEDEDENPEYEEIPLDCLLKNKNLNSESSEDYLEQDYQLASEEIGGKENESNDSTKKESIESFKSVTCIKENAVKQKKSSSRWQKLLKKKSSVASNSKMNLDFYPQEKMSILDMIQSVQATSISDDAINRSPRDKVLNVISSGEVSKQSEKQFFDNLLAFYDKESELIKKLIRDDEFFSSLIEAIRNTEDSTQLIFQRDSQKKARKEKKKGILSRFFRWKEKKSTETLFDNFSIGKSLEFAKSMSNDITATNGESCYSFYKDLDDYDKDVNEVKHPNSEYLQQLAYKAKCHLEPMVKATISNRHISDKIKLAGFLKMLDMVAKGDFTFLNTGDNKTLEEKLKDHVAQMFEKVYRIANHEVIQKDSILDNDKIQLLKMLVTKYHMGIETHLNILSIYIGRSLIETKAQLEDAIIFLMGQDSQDINLEQFEKNCGISSA